MARPKAAKPVPAACVGARTSFQMPDGPCNAPSGKPWNLTAATDAQAEVGLLQADAIGLSGQTSEGAVFVRARNAVRRIGQVLGPGLTTGAADDDPSGIATYSQAGAQFGYQLTWTVFLTL